MSRSGFYQYLKYGSGYDIDPDFFLLSRAWQIQLEIRASYGSRRMSRQLRDEGHDVGRFRARSLMKKAGIKVKYRKKFKKTIDSNHKPPVAPNLPNRKFAVDRPNEVWCSDISVLQQR